MFLVKGANGFLMQVEKILGEYPGLGCNHLITLDSENDNDTMTVEVEFDEMGTDLHLELHRI